jgi:hypothetical protein
MSTDSLNGVVGQAAHFAGDYLFRDVSLPNNTTINSEEHTLNNTLGRLQLTGVINQSLTMAAANTMSIVLQYKDGTNWVNDKTLLTLSGVGTLAAGQVFAMIPVPSDTKRIYRLQVVSNFNASTVKLTAAVEILPLA